MLWGDPNKYPITEEGLRDLYRDHPEADPFRGQTREDLLAIERLVKAATRSWREAIARGEFKAKPSAGAERE